MGIIEDVDISSIEPSPFNCRCNTDPIEDLANSIREKGLLQPIVIRNKDSHYEIVSGNRRLRACRSLGLRKILCHIVELDDKEAFEVSLVENIQRKTLRPIEEAEAFRRYILNYGWGGMSSLGIKIGKSTTYVHRRLKLLELPPGVLNSILESSITTAAAEELISVQDKETQSELGKLVCKHRMSSRKVRELVREFKDDETKYSYSGVVDLDLRTKRSFDKSVIALRVALNKIGTIISEIEENWVAYEILMQHKNMLHSQIDLLIKEKKKL